MKLGNKNKGGAKSPGKVTNPFPKSRVAPPKRGGMIKRIMGSLKRTNRGR